MKLNEKITKLRKQKGLSQEALAEKLSVSRQAISKWETGESLPDMDNIAFLCKEFDVSADFLLNDSVENPNEFCVLHDNSQTTAKKLTATRIALICVSCVLALILILVPVYALIVQDYKAATEFLNQGEYISGVNIYRVISDSSYTNVELILKEEYDNIDVVFLIKNNSGLITEYPATREGSSYIAKMYITKNNSQQIITAKITVGNHIFTAALARVDISYNSFHTYEEIWDNN